MKNHFIAIVIFLLLNNGLLAQNASSKMIVFLKAGKIKLNKKDVIKEWKLNSFTAILDTFSRKKEGLNRVYTYDNLGIVLFEPSPQKKPTGLVSEFQIILDETETSSITPKSFYEGKLTIDKMDFTRNAVIEEIRKKLTDYKEIETDENDKYRFSKDGIYLYFIYNKNKNLSKVIFGKDKLIQ